MPISEKEFREVKGGRLPILSIPGFTAPEEFPEPFPNIENRILGLLKHYEIAATKEEVLNMIRLSAGINCFALETLISPQIILDILLSFSKYCEITDPTAPPPSKSISIS